MKKIFSIGLLVMFALTLVVVPVQAQETSPTPTPEVQEPNSPQSPTVGPCRIIYWDSVLIVAFLDNAPQGTGYTYHGVLRLRDKVTGVEFAIYSDNEIYYSGGVQYDYFFYGDGHGWIIPWGSCGYTTPHPDTVWIDLDRVYSADFRNAKLFLPFVTRN